MEEYKSLTVQELHDLRVRLAKHANDFGVKPSLPSTVSPKEENNGPSKRDIIAGFAILGGVLLAIAVGGYYLSTHHAPVEALANGTNSILFQCVSDPELAKQAGWQMVTQTVDGTKDLMQTAAQKMAELGHGFANAAGTVFQRGASQTGFHQVYIPPGGALSLSGVIDSCPAQMVPLP